MIHNNACKLDEIGPKINFKINFATKCLANGQRAASHVFESMIIFQNCKTIDMPEIRHNCNFSAGFTVLVDKQE